MINNLSTPPSECNINAMSSSRSSATPESPTAHKLFWHNYWTCFSWAWFKWFLHFADIPQAVQFDRVKRAADALSILKAYGACITAVQASLLCRQWQTFSRGTISGKPMAYKGGTCRYVHRQSFRCKINAVLWASRLTRRSCLKWEVVLY